MSDWLLGTGMKVHCALVVLLIKIRANIRLEYNLQEVHPLSCDNWHILPNVLKKLSSIKKIYSKSPIFLRSASSYC